MALSVRQEELMAEGAAYAGGEGQMRVSYVPRRGLEDASGTL
jgi:hypothetical protein